MRFGAGEHKDIGKAIDCMYWKMKQKKKKATGAKDLKEEKKHT